MKVNRVGNGICFYIRRSLITYDPIFHGFSNQKTMIRYNWNGNVIGYCKDFDNKLFYI